MTGNMTTFFRVSRIYWSEIIQVKRKPPLSRPGPITATQYCISVCDFTVWTPKDCAIIRTTKQLSWETNISDLTDFYFNKRCL